jgi:phage terminase Nu1 subunit (DNA packaging protein)
MPSIDEEGKQISVADLAELLGVSVGELTRIPETDLPVREVGGRVTYSMRDVLRYLQRLKAESAEMIDRAQALLRKSLH